MDNEPKASEVLPQIRNEVESLAKTMQEYRDNSEKNEKRYDGVLEDQGKKLEAALEAHEAALQRFNNIEAAVKRGDLSSQEEKDAKEEQERKESFESFLRCRDESGNDKKQVEVLTRSMSTDNLPQGGFLVRPEFSNFVSQRIFETSPLRRVARQETISSKSLTILLDDDEAAASWGNEGSGGSGDTDTPDLGEIEITAFKLNARPRATEEQIADSAIDLESWLQAKVADKFARSENTAFIAGNGVGRPRGITQYDAWTSAGVYESNKLEQINSGSNGAITADGLIDLQNSLLEAYQSRAVYLMKRASFGEVMKLKDSDNQYLLGLGLNENRMMVPMVNGKEVIFTDDMPATGGTGNLAVAYGDFGVGYTIVDRMGLSILRDPFTNKGLVEYYTTKRTGGQVTNFQAIKLLKLSS